MLIFDTNIWVSYSLMPASNLEKTVDQILDQNLYAFSQSSYVELSEVLMREKFDKYFSHKKRQRTLKQIALAAEWFTPSEKIHDCRDPKDNLFLELAAASKAEYLITGDKDLLVLDPFRKTRVLTPTDFAEHHLSDA